MNASVKVIEAKGRCLFFIFPWCCFNVRRPHRSTMGKLARNSGFRTRLGPKQVASTE